MVADGLTKALTITKYKNFVDIIGIKDITSLFASIKIKDNKKHIQVETEYNVTFE